MNKKFIFIGMMIGILLVVGFLWVGSSMKALANSGSSVQAATPSPASGQAAPWRIMDNGANDEVAPAGSGIEVLAPNALPTPVPGETQVYFFPSDSDATATVLYLLNTDTVEHIVALRGFSYNGVLVYSLNINVPATSMLRLISDSVASAPPPSWATPAPIITNFTDFTYFASLSLAKGVKVEGYTVFNPGTGVVDPRADQGAMPLRFSTDPNAVFLPMTQNNP